MSGLQKGGLQGAAELLAAVQPPDGEFQVAVEETTHPLAAPQPASHLHGANLDSVQSTLLQLSFDISTAECSQNVWKHASFSFARTSIPLLLLFPARVATQNHTAGLRTVRCARRIVAQTRWRKRQSRHQATDWHSIAFANVSDATSPTI